jgi:hypothetical protein
MGSHDGTTTVFGEGSKNARNQAKYCFIWSLLTRERMGNDVLEDEDNTMPCHDLFVRGLRHENAGVRPKRLVINESHKPLNSERHSSYSPSNSQVLY